MTRRSSVPFADQLPALMKERRLSTNRLAGMVGVNQSHLSRVLRGASGRSVGGELAARIALALGFPDDWFAETRQARLFERLKGDVELCDRLYDQLVAPRAR